MPKAAAAGALLGQLLQQWGLAGKMREYQAWQVWDEVVGPQIAARARPARIRDGVLEVRVDQAVWMQQLQLLKPKILTRLNERLGGNVITDIFWRRGRTEDAMATPAAPGAGRPWLGQRLTGEDQSRIEAAVQAVADPELRRGLQNIFSRQVKLAKSLEQQTGQEKESAAKS